MNLKQILFIAAVLFIGCSQDQKPLGPAKVYYGEDICERCKMIVSEKGFAAQYVFNDGKDKVFDDIGCMMLYYNEVENNKDGIIAFYVRDSGSGEWISGEDAHYFWSGDLKTPMGYGVFALGKKENITKHSELDKSQSLGGFAKTVKWIVKEQNSK